MAEKTKGKKQSAIVVKEKKVARALSTRGRIFRGIVTRKFPKRIMIEFERTVRIPKFERFMKKKTRIHARLPDNLAEEVHIGDLAEVRECRPLSKIIHFIVVKKIKKFPNPSLSPQQADGVLRSASGRKSLIFHLERSKLRGIKPKWKIKSGDENRERK